MLQSVGGHLEKAGGAVLGGWGGQFRAEVPVCCGIPQGSVLVSFPLPSVLPFWPPS